MGFLPLLIKVPGIALLMAAGGNGIVPGLTAAPGAGIAPLVIASGVVHVRADGHTWDLSVFAVQAGRTGIIEADVSRTSAAGTELHAWDVAPRSAVVTKTARGWKIEPRAAAVSPLMSVDLRFTITSHSAARCSKGSATLYRGRLAGRMILTSHLRKLGKVGGRSVSFSAPNVAEVDHGCVTRRPPCPAPGFAWTADTTVKAGIGFLDGSLSRGQNSIDLARATRLARPARSARIDAALVTGGTLTVAASTLQATPGAGSLLSGSVTITGSGTPTFNHFACWRNGHKHTATDENFGNGPVTSSLVAHTLLTGTVSAGTSGTGSFDKITIG